MSTVGEGLLEEVRRERIAFRLGVLCAVTTLGLLLAAAPLLRELEPAGLAAGFSLARLALQGLACFAGGLAILWVLSRGWLPAVADPGRPAAGALDAVHGFPIAFAAASLAVWAAAAGVALAVEPASATPAVGLAGRCAAFAALGLVAAAANALIADRVLAPARSALATRATPDQRVHAAPALPLAGQLCLLVVALVLAPALMHGALGQARAAHLGGAATPAPGLEIPAFALALLAVGLVLVRQVVAGARETATSLRAAATQAARGGEAKAAWVAPEFAAVAEALVALSGATRATRQAITGAIQELGSGLSDLDVARESVVSLTGAEVAGVQALIQEMGTVHAHSEKIADSIQELRMAVDESSSAVTELGAAGEQLVGTAGELQGRSDTVTTSIRQALASLDEVANSTEVLAGVAGDASSSMEEMAASMRDVNESAERCAELSDQVVSVADRGSQVVQQTIDGMQAIRQATATAEQVIRGLGDRAGEIGAIVEVIEGVANETSLLALNAAIIAAQAGEHGRAFSVVAGEIRELATRVSSSTAEITNLIRSVQDESTNAIGAIESGAKSVANGVGLSEQAGRSLIEITRVARSNKKLVEGIVHSVGEQTKAAGHVVGVIEEVSSQADRIRRAAREQQQGNDLVLDQARALDEIAQQVHRTADEQSRGTRLVVATVESIVAGLERIGSSVGEQTTAVARVVASTWQAHKRAQDTKEAAGALAKVSDLLRRSADAVREIVSSRPS